MRQESSETRETGYSDGQTSGRITRRSEFAAQQSRQAHNPEVVRR
jgi:hypothetical protein